MCSQNQDIIKMQQHYITHNAPLRFRRYSRKGYAAFRSMHREVVVGHVVNDIADRQLAKSGRGVECSAAFVGVLGFAAEENDMLSDAGCVAATVASMTELLVFVARQTASEAAAASAVNNNKLNMRKGNSHCASCLSSFQTINCFK